MSRAGIINREQWLVVLERIPMAPREMPPTLFDVAARRARAAPCRYEIAAAAGVRCRSRPIAKAAMHGVISAIECNYAQTQPVCRPAPNLPIHPPPLFFCSTSVPASVLRRPSPSCPPPQTHGGVRADGGRKGREVAQAQQGVGRGRGHARRQKVGRRAGGWGTVKSLFSLMLP